MQIKYELCDGGRNNVFLINKLLLPNLFVLDKGYVGGLEIIYFEYGCFEPRFNEEVWKGCDWADREVRFLERFYYNVIEPRQLNEN